MNQHVIHDGNSSEESAGSNERLYTYTIITTDSNASLKFLHDRMPVILDHGSDAIWVWLDPARSTWSTELQSLLRPYEGALDVYPVRKEVGKVGNNSAAFIVPLSSSADKHSIANFFDRGKVVKPESKSDSADPRDDVPSRPPGLEIKHEEEKDNDDDDGATVSTAINAEHHAPSPIPTRPGAAHPELKRKLVEDDGDEESHASSSSSPSTADHDEAENARSTAPVTRASTGRPTRSATSNMTAESRPYRSSSGTGIDGSRKITQFWGR